MKKTVKKVLAMLLVVCMALPMFVTSITADTIEGELPVTGGRNGASYVYDDSTNILTITMTGSGALIYLKTNLTSGGAEFTGKVKEIVVKNGEKSLTDMTHETFSNFPELTKVTIPATVTRTSWSNARTFLGSKNFKELVVEGNAYIPGAVDFSNITSATLNATSTPHLTFANTAIETLILKGGVYSNEYPIAITGKTSTTTYNMLGTSLKTIMGPSDDAYLKAFCEKNGYDYVPYGKIGTGTAWTYDEATKTVTIYGDGKGCALTAPDPDAPQIPEDAENLIIRDDITSIAGGAFAGLVNLKKVVFEGKVPAVEAEANPFAEGFDDKITATTFNVSPSTTTRNDDYWADKTFTAYSGTYEGIIGTDNPDKIDVENKWSYDITSKTLTISRVTTGRAQTKLPNAAEPWGAYKTEIEHIVIDSSIERISQNSFIGHTALKTVTLPGVKRSIGADAFKGCTSLTTISMNGHAVIPGIADLSLGSNTPGDATGSSSSIQLFRTPYSNSAYKDTKIEGIMLPAGANSGGVAISVNSGFLSANQTSIIVKYNDTSESAHKDFCEKNGKTLKYYGKTSDNKITWIYNPSDKSLSIYGTGDFASFNLETGYENFLANVETLHIDEGITSIGTEAFEIIKTFMLKGDGIAVRYKEYNGLRNIYSFNNGVNDQMEKFGYELVEYGAMLVSSNKLGTDELTLDENLEPTVDGAVKRAVWNKDATDNPWVGKVLSYDEKGKTEFAITLAKFTDNWDSDVYSRAYAVFSNGTTNFVVYADNSMISLYDAMVSGCKQGVLDGYVCDDVAVWNVLATGKVANGDINAGDGIQAMVINGKTNEDAKVLVVRMANGELADDDAIAAAKTAAETADYTLDDTVIALDFLADEE